MTWGRTNIYALYLYPHMHDAWGTKWDECKQNRAILRNVWRRNTGWKGGRSREWLRTQTGHEAKPREEGKKPKGKKKEEKLPRRLVTEVCKPRLMYVVANLASMFCLAPATGHETSSNSSSVVICFWLFLVRSKRNSVNSTFRCGTLPFPFLSSFFPLRHPLLSPFHSLAVPPFSHRETEHDP